MATGKVLLDETLAHRLEKLLLLILVQYLFHLQNMVENHLLHRGLKLQNTLPDLIGVGHVHVILFHQGHHDVTLFMNLI